MIIGCTKRLQDEIGITPEKGYEERELFSWSANLVKINRRKAVVIVNDSNRFGFVLFGLKTKDFKKIDELILQGIKRYLQQLKIKEEIVEQYLSDVGAIIYSKTKGPRYVARLNKACELVGYFEELLDLENIYQDKVSRKLNDNFIKIDKSNYKLPYELLLEDFKQNYKDSIIKCEAANLIVKLDLGVHTAERRIITPMDINFKELHEILHVAFDWKECHLHEFNIINEKGERVLNVISEHEDYFDLHEDCEVIFESEVFIKNYMKNNFTIKYCYDFGDNWQHEITVEGVILDYDKNYPFCIEGIGDEPPEDVGGIQGYEEFLEIMANPKHSEYEWMKRWAESQRYKKFDIDLVNKRLKYALWE